MRQNRSNKYQYKFAETGVDTDFLAVLALYKDECLLPAEIEEYCFKLEEQLKNTFYTVIKGALTPRQFEIFETVSQCETLLEAGKKLNINQSSVFNQIHKGAFIPKIIYAVKTNEQIIQIVNNISLILNLWDNELFLPYYKACSQAIPSECLLINLKLNMERDQSQKAPRQPAEVKAIIEDFWLGVRIKTIQAKYHIGQKKLYKIFKENLITDGDIKMMRSKKTSKGNIVRIKNGFHQARKGNRWI